MFTKIYTNLTLVRKALANHLSGFAPIVQTEKWQGTEGRPMREALNISFSVPMGNNREEMVRDFKPNLPWADLHFEERVSGIPHNPPPSHLYWPFAKNNNEVFLNNEKFSHTYPERFWPKLACSNPTNFSSAMALKAPPNHGIRFNYGDLDDVLRLLQKEPNTRQAYLPIWFPEDTGVVEGQRVPCSIGYHFQIRGKRLNISYVLRSCDLLLHFNDDMYMAYRLAEWVKSNLHTDIELGFLNVTIYNLHCFAEAEFQLEKIIKNG